MRIRRSVAIAFAVCLLPLALAAQTPSLDLNTPLPLDSKVRTGKLPNGLTYFVRQNGKPEHRAELKLVVQAGSILEDDDQQGIAHLNEHMAFNGTAKFPHNDLPSFLEAHGMRFGAHVNAYTSFDETVYRLTFPTDRGALLDTGLDILAEWAHSVTFDSLETEKERGVVGEEWRLGLGASERIRNKEIPFLYQGSRYAERLPIGKKPVIDTARQARISQFYKDWYRPDLMAVIVVGDIDPVAMEKEIQAKFGSLANPAHERPRTDFDIPLKPQILATSNVDKEVTNPRFSMLFKHPNHEEVTVGDYRGELVSNMVDQMLNARLGEEVTRGSAPLAGAFVYDARMTSTVRQFNVGSSLKPDSVDQGIRALMQEVYRAKQNGFTSPELDRTKKEMMSSIETDYKERDKTNSDRIAGEYLRYVLDKEPSPGIEYEYEIYKKYLDGITLDEVNAAAKARFDNASVVLSFAGPDGAGTTTPSQDALIAQLKGVEAEHLVAYVDEASNKPLIAHAPKPGKIVSETQIKEIGVTEWKLSNGARVLLKPTDFKDDEILFQAIAPGGSSIASDADVISANFATSIVNSSGYGDLDIISLGKQLAGKEVRLNPYISSLQQGMSGTSTKKDIETLFQLAYLHHTAPRFDSSTASGGMSRMSSMLKNRDKNPQSAFMDTLSVTMNQYNSREQPMTAERLKLVNLRTGYDYYRARFEDASNFTYILIGNFDLATVKPLVEEYLASAPAIHKQETWRDLAIVPPRGVIKKAVYKGVEPKSSVRIVFTGPFQYNRENRMKMSVMTQALAIKLREDLREDKSGVYGIGVTGTPSKYPKEKYSLSISFGCAPDRAQELIDEVMRQVDTITTKGIEPIYLAKVKETIKSELETNLKENNYWMSRLQEWAWEGTDPKSVLTGKQAIDAVTGADVLTAAKQYLDTKNYVQVVLYPEKKS